MAPSEVALKKLYCPFFNPPRVLIIEEITAITDRFGLAAEIARKAGFTGVQIEGGNHSNFGYYGFQNGDGKSLISREEQHKEVAERLDDFIRGRQ